MCEAITRVPHHRMFIDGEWTDGTGHYDVINPADEQVVATVARAETRDADAAVAAAVRAYRHGPWRRTSAAERAAVFERAADAISGRADELARSCGGLFRGLGD